MSATPLIERRVNIGDQRASSYGRRSSDIAELRQRLVPELLAAHSIAAQAAILQIIAGKNYLDTHSISDKNYRESVAPRMAILFNLHVLMMKKNLPAVVELGRLNTEMLHEKREQFYRPAGRMLITSEEYRRGQLAESLRLATNAQLQFPELGFAAHLAHHVSGESISENQILQDLASDYVLYGVQTLGEMQKQRTAHTE